MPVMDGEAPDYRDQVLQHLRQQSMQAHAALLAIPNKLPDRLQWFTDAPGDIQKLRDAPAPARQAAIGQVQGLLAEIGREAARLAEERAPSARALAEVMRAALEGTGEDALRESDIWLVGGQPVVSGWGMRAVATAGPAPDLLGRRDVAAPPRLAPPPPVEPLLAQAAPVAEAPVPVARSPWPLRLLALAALLLLLAGAAALLVPWLVPIAVAAFRLPPPPSCDVAAPDGGVLALQAEEVRLRAAIASLEGALSHDILQCRIDAAPPPTPAQPPPQAPPAPEPHADMDQRLQREGAKSAATQVTLAWDSRADLDLHVLCPDGAEIKFNRQAGCGGILDVDMNARPGPVSDTPVENVVWPNGAMPGKYRVVVDNYTARQETGAPAVPFTLRITTGGQKREMRGTASGGPLRVFTEFDVP